MINLRKFYNRAIYRLLRYRNININNRLSTPNLIASSLQRHGIVIMSWQEVFGCNHHESELFKLLESEAKAKLRSSGGHGVLGWKSTYLQKAYAHGETIDESSALIKLAKTPQIQNIATSFFGGKNRLLAADYWRSAGRGVSRVASQLWHTDPEDTIMFKLFVYLTDVDPLNGATEFIIGSQVGGRNELRLFEVDGTSGRYYSEDEIVELERLKVDIKAASGEKGTCVFINTTGIHRGGYGEGERLMANYTFVYSFCPLKTRWM